jgi:DNA topoisomerase-2
VYYGRRKAYLIDVLEKELIILSNKVRYIQEILKGTIDLRKKKKDEIIKMLEDKKYQKIVNGDNNVVDEEYKYLVRMPMDAVSEENVEKLLGEHKNKTQELEEIKATTCESMWFRELDALNVEYSNYRMERDIAINGLVKGSNSKPKIVVKGASSKKKIQLQEL